MLRNEGGEINEGGEWENLDVLFEGIFYLEMPTASSKRIIIYKGNKEDQEYLESRYFEGIIWHGGLSVFVLEIENKKYYIGANRFLVSTNKLFQWQTSIDAPKQ